MTVPRNSRTQKDVYREIYEDIQLALEGDPYADSLEEVEESIHNAYRLGLLTGPQYDRLKERLLGD